MTSMKRFQKACAWSGILCVFLFFLAFVFADFIPPLSPDDSAEEIAAHYQDHTDGVRIGAAIMLMSPMFYMTFTGVIAAQMRRIPGVHRAVVYTQLASGAFAGVTFLVPAMLFLVTAFRPDRPIEDTQLLSDMSFILLIIAYQPFLPQIGAFVFAILSDKRENPLFPRWLAYANAWIAILFTPAVCLAFFKTGPLAWDGVFCFWIPATVFILFFAVNTAMLLKAISREEAEAVEGRSGTDSPSAGRSEGRIGSTSPAG